MNPHNCKLLEASYYTPLCVTPFNKSLGQEANLELILWKCPVGFMEAGSQLLRRSSALCQGPSGINECQQQLRRNRIDRSFPFYVLVFIADVLIKANTLT